MRLLCLDLSTHAGFADFEWDGSSKPTLTSHGTIHLGKNVLEYGPYPFCYPRAAQEMAKKILSYSGLLNQPVDVFVVEEINLGRNRYTQKILENVHRSVLDVLALYLDQHKEEAGRDVRVVYLDSSEWRHNLGLRMSKEQKRSNAKLSKAKRLVAESGAKLDKKSLGIKGKTTPKHLAVAYANQAYDLRLKMKDNDAADAICLGLAFCNGATPCDGV